jgi:hypothetical protein
MGAQGLSREARAVNMILIKDPRPAIADARIAGLALAYDFFGVHHG